MQPTTIVPPQRLGQLLTEARLEAGHDLEDLARTSDGLFTVGELADIENGHRHLDDKIIEAITGLYAIDCGPIVPQRAELTIDLDRSLVSAAGRSMPLTLATRDHVLDRYLSLVYILRNREPGSEVPLRQEDLAILAASLAERSELIEEQLLAAMAAEPQRITGLASWFRNRLWVPGTGALVGVVSVGTLVMVSGPPQADTDTTALPLPEPLPDPRTTDTAVPTTVPSVAVVAEASSTVETIAAEAATPPTTAVGAVAPPTTTAPATTPSSIAVPTSAASTTSTPTTTTTASAAALGAEAEALMPIDIRASLPNWEIEYLGHNDSFRGLTFPYAKTIEVYVRDGDTPHELAAIVAHEVGHALDVQYLSSGDRTQWKQARDIGDRPWWPNAYASDFQTGAGDFAEGFAYWALGARSYSEIGGPLTGEQLTLLEALIRPYIQRS